MTSDEELYQAYIRGQKASFDVLVKRYWDRVYQFVLRIVRDEATAEDVLISTFYKLHTAAPTWEHRARFSTFLYTIAWRESVSVLRAQKRRPNLVGGGETADGPGWLETHRADVADPEELVSQKNRIRQVDEVLKLLPEGHRAAFTLFYREELSIQEIAEALDLQPGSVRAYLTFARTALRQACEAEEAASLAVGSGRQKL